MCWALAQLSQYHAIIDLSRINTYCWLRTTEKSLNSHQTYFCVREHKTGLVKETKERSPKLVNEETAHAHLIITYLKSMFWSMFNKDYGRFIQHITTSYNNTRISASPSHHHRLNFKLWRQINSRFIFWTKWGSSTLATVIFKVFATGIKMESSE